MKWLHVRMRSVVPLICAGRLARLQHGQERGSRHACPGDLQEAAAVDRSVVRLDGPKITHRLDLLEGKGYK